MAKLENKIAVITGGGSGIGRSICEKFSAEGAHSCVLDYSEEQGAETVALIEAAGGKATFYQCDVSNTDRINEVFETIAADLAPVDLLVNNAGIAAIGDVEVCSADELDRVYNVNVKGVYNCLQAAVKQMSGRGGAIVNMASVASHIGLADRFAYSMSKGAVFTMTQSVATDYVEKGIRCNSVSPGRVHTPFVDGFLAKNYPGEEEEMFKKLSATQPIGRMGKPEEIAGLVFYLCSEDAAFITGSDFAIDGGFVKIKK